VVEERFWKRVFMVVKGEGKSVCVWRLAVRRGIEERKPWGGGNEFY